MVFNINKGFAKYVFHPAFAAVVVTDNLDYVVADIVEDIVEEIKLRIVVVVEGAAVDVRSFSDFFDADFVNRLCFHKLDKALLQNFARHSRASVERFNGHKVRLLMIY